MVLIKLVYQESKNKQIVRYTINHFLTMDNYAITNYAILRTILHITSFTKIHV